MPKSEFKFQDEKTLEERTAEANKIREKYPDRIPVIVERAKGSDVDDIDKRKFLVPKDLTVGQFVYVIRKRIKLAPEQAIYVFVNGSLPASSALMSQLYKDHKQSDNFLYATYSGEQTFGAQ